MVVLGLLSTFGPISLDHYLPALAAELGSPPSAAQVTIAACLVGLRLRPAYDGGGTGGPW